MTAPTCLGCGHEHKCSVHGCAIIRGAASRLAAYEEKQEQGLVVELPCPIGTKIFEADQHMGKVFQRLASKEDMLTKIVRGWGKRYFATPEEAEAAILKERME